jgi:hypothetical protein
MAPWQLVALGSKAAQQPNKMVVYFCGSCRLRAALIGGRKRKEFQ